MLESMTGYGSAESVASGVKILVELRSVNNRFAEISVKLPRQLLPYEIEVRELIRSRFQRGKISAFVQLQADDEQPLQQHSMLKRLRPIVIFLTSFVMLPALRPR